MQEQGREVRLFLEQVHRNGVAVSWRSEPFHDCHDRFNGSAMQSDRNVVSSLVVHEPSSHSLTVSAEVSGADSLES